jgi:xanthine dehydrogenase accessory factor
MNEPLPDLLRRAAALQREGRRVIACLLVNARGSTPQSAGALMLVDDAAEILGTIGGGCVEAELRQRAFRMLGDNETGLLTFKLDHDYGWDDGLICGGTLTLAIAPPPDADELDKIIGAIEERRPTSFDLRFDTDEGPAVCTYHIPPRPRLYIAGAGHIAQATAFSALRLDFEVTMFDDRHDLLEKLAPAGARKVAGDIAENLTARPIDDQTFCVIVTRGHRHDAQALAAVVNRGAAYVGMIGSRRKVKLTFDELMERGVPADELEKVHAPIGLDIGAVSVEEIAIAIAAQLVQVRRKTKQTIVEGPRPADSP